MSRKIVILLFTLVACSGVEPNDRSYFMVIDDTPCGGPASPDTIIYLDGAGPNAALFHLDSAFGSPPARELLQVFGNVSGHPDLYSSLSFIMLRTPTPPPVGTYPIRPIADSTIHLQEYRAYWEDVGYWYDHYSNLPEPFTGSIVVARSSREGIEGTFTVTGKYFHGEDSTLRCMSAKGQFTSVQPTS
jgi:hypothetical protein